MSVRIESIEEKHTLSVQELASDPDIGATTENIPIPYPSDGAITWIRKTIGLRTEKKEYAFAVMDREMFVGVSSLTNVDSSTRTAHLGYWIGKPFWGRGYATQASRLVLIFGFNQLGLELVYAICLERNSELPPI